MFPRQNVAQTQSFAELKIVILPLFKTNKTSKDQYLSSFT